MKRKGVGKWLARFANVLNDAAERRRVFGGLIMKTDITAESRVKEWYMNEYPEDKQFGTMLNEGTTFADVYSALENHQEIYELLGGHMDTLIRERVFRKLAEIYGVEVGVFMDKWLEDVWEVLGMAYLKAGVSVRERTMDREHDDLC